MFNLPSFAFAQRRITFLFLLLSGSSCSSSSDSNTSSASSGGQGSGGAAAITDPCAAVIANEQVKCPGIDTTADQIDCSQGQTLYAGEGCASQWQAQQTCLANAQLDCDTGEAAACDAEYNALLACQSMFVANTGCVRLATQDSVRCTDSSKPYADGCVGAAPASCTIVVSTPTVIACCPIP